MELLHVQIDEAEISVRILYFRVFNMCGEGSLEYVLLEPMTLKSILDHLKGKLVEVDGFLRFILRLDLADMIWCLG
jgi:hypothetical protein